MTHKFIRALSVGLLWLPLVVTDARLALGQTTLPNGIVLPSKWPPATTPNQAYQLPSYITNPPSVIPIDLGRQLFVDDFLIASTTMTRTQHQPVMYPGNPILVPGVHDTANAAMPYSDGVWFEPSSGLFKMWFYCGPGNITCYAYSSDGKNWTRPSLPNAVLPYTDEVLQIGGLRDSATEWLDLNDPNPNARYKSFAYYPPENLLVYFSPDGITWTAQPQYNILSLSDRSTMFWNPFRNVWVDSLRAQITLPASANRASYGARVRYYAESPDLVHWTPADFTDTFWTGPDDHDPPYVAGGAFPQLYNLDAVAYESVMVGLFSWFYPGPAQANNDPSGLPGPDLVELGVGFSRDGFNWVRPTRGSGPTAAFIPASNTPGTWNMGNTQSAGGGFLVVGDELWFYFSGRNAPHGTETRSATGLATLRRDGFYSMDAGSTQAALTTRPVTFSGKYLFVNVNDPSGQLLVEITDASGAVIGPFSRANCVPLSVNQTLQQVSWTNGGATVTDISSLDGKSVHFNFYLTSGSLYSFWVSPSTTGASQGYTAAMGPGLTGPIDTSVPATPRITPPGGFSNGPVPVSITDITLGASIYYTLDGTTPTCSSTPYAGSIQVTPAATVKAIACTAQPMVSAIATAIFNLPGNASLTGNWVSPSGTQNLTTLGTADWAHWGLSSSASFDHKASGGSQIGNYSVITGAQTQVATYGNNQFPYTWSDGTPTAATTTSTGVYISGAGLGLQIAVPADLTPRTVTVYVGIYNTQGRLMAHLSDGSAPDYVDTSLSSSGSVPRAYTLNYASATPGQTLTISITNIGSSGNVNLEAATLTQGAATPTPDFTISANPSTQTVTAGNSTTYTVTTTALNGFSGSVGLSASGLPSGATAGFVPTSITGAGTSTLTITTTSTTATGSSTLTIAGNNNTLTHSATAGLTVNAVGTGGGGPSNLSGSWITPSGTQNLTASGTTDWAHWGLSSSASFDHKASGGSQIGNYSVLNGAQTQVATYANNQFPYSWSDGTPTAAATTSTGVYISGPNLGFQITVPADTTPRILTVYLGVYATQGRFVAHLSDGSAPDYVDTSLSSSGSVPRAYTLDYTAASAGQTLSISFTNMGSSGNVNLQAATLTPGAGPTAPDFTISAVPSTQTVTAGNSTTYTVTTTALNGFNGSVNLSAGGLPSGATAGFVPSSITGAGASTLTITTTSGTALGGSTLTITGTGTTSTHATTAGLTVNAVGTGGAGLSGSWITPSGTENLTALGTADWAHWGLSSSVSFDHKASGGSQIGSYSVINGVQGEVASFGGNPIAYSWSDGTPTAAYTTATGVYISGANLGFQIAIPADTTSRIVTVYVGVYATQGRLVAHLSDGSAPDYVDTSLSSSGSAPRAYTLSYVAASAGQTLTISFTNNGSSGNVNLQAATLIH